MDGRTAQWTRFRTLLQGLPIAEGDSLLDLGCGVGHLVDYILQEASLSWGPQVALLAHYTGCDPHPEAILRAQERHPSLWWRFISGGIDADGLSAHYDWIVMSGIFNIGVQETELWRIVEKACRVARHGIAFNLLHAPYEHEEYCAYSPRDVKEQLELRLGNTLAPQVTHQRGGSVAAALDSAHAVGAMGRFTVRVTEEYGVEDEFTVHVLFAPEE
jgi:SAM-dependent methyltransferase